MIKSMFLTRRFSGLLLLRSLFSGLFTGDLFSFLFSRAHMFFAFRIFGSTFFTNRHKTYLFLTFKCVLKFLEKIKTLEKSVIHFCLLKATPPIKIAAKEKIEIMVRLSEKGMKEKPIIVFLRDSTP